MLTIEFVGIRVVRGFDAAHNSVLDMLSSRSVIALRDYWEWWSAHAEHADYGKVRAFLHIVKPHFSSLMACIS